MNKILALETLLSVIFILLIGIGVIKFVLSHSRKKGAHHKAFNRLERSQPYLLLCFLLLFIICIIISTLLFSKSFLPHPLSKPFTGIAPLFTTTMIITCIAFFFTQVLLFYFAFRFRKKAGSSALFIKGFLKLELFWTIVPALFFMFLFLWGQILWAKIIDDPSGDALVIEVMAEQFNWQVRYGGPDNRLGQSSFRLINTINAMGIDVNDPNSKDDFIPVQMHIPKNRPVKLLLHSKDVIHSFYIPLFRTKMDAVPGMVTTMHFTATTSTDEMRIKLQNADFNYEVACAELCGRMHFAMKLILVVDEPNQFDDWYAKQKSWISGTH